MFLLACLFGVNVLALSLYTMCLGNSVTNSVFIKKISLSGLSLLAFSVLSKKKFLGLLNLILSLVLVSVTLKTVLWCCMCFVTLYFLFNLLGM